MNLCISTHKYDILSFCELSKKQQEKARREFDWIENIETSYGFFIYKKSLFYLDSFMQHNDFLTDEKTGKKFYSHGIMNWSAFNGLALEVISNTAVKVAYYY